MIKKHITYIAIEHRNSNFFSVLDLSQSWPFKLRGLFALGGLYADLEDALKKSIDVVTTGSLKYNKDEAFLENLRKDRVLLYELS